MNRSTRLDEPRAIVLCNEHPPDGSDINDAVEEGFIAAMQNWRFEHKDMKHSSSNVALNTTRRLVPRQKDAS
jgi:hypothetical protein